MDVVARPELDAVSPTTRDGFVQHWANTRIDQPREIMARHDEAAKQLVAVAAFLQGIYLAAFTFGNLQASVSPILLIPMFLPVLSIVICAATVICTVPRDLNVYNVFRLLTRDTSNTSPAGGVDIEIKRWCEEVDRLAAKKARWLHRANWSFIAASIVTVALLSAAAMM